MNTNEKKPIGFDMELTEEQLKNVAGGDFHTFAKYRCSRGHETEQAFYNITAPAWISCPGCGQQSFLMFDSTVREKD